MAHEYHAMIHLNGLSPERNKWDSINRWQLRMMNYAFPIFSRKPKYFPSKRNKFNNMSRMINVYVALWIME